MPARAAVRRGRQLRVPLLRQEQQARWRQSGAPRQYLRAGGKGLHAVVHLQRLAQRAQVVAGVGQCAAQAGKTVVRDRGGQSAHAH